MIHCFGDEFHQHTDSLRYLLISKTSHYQHTDGTHGPAN